MKTIIITENGVEFEYKCDLVSTKVLKDTIDKPKGKLISEWLKELPDGYRELALANFKEQRKKDVHLDCINEAIRQGFSWFMTKEMEFWDYVHDFYTEKRNGLPPLPKPKFEVWMPKVGDLICNIDYDGGVSRCLFIEGEAPYKAFQTKEQALEAHEKALFNYEVEMFIKEKNEGWEPDYTNENQRKYFIIFSDGVFLIDYYNIRKVTSDSKVFKSEQIGEEILAKFDNDKLLKYWI